MRGRERIPGVPVESQEEALSTGKARETPVSFHHSKSPPDISVCRGPAPLDPGNSMDGRR